MSTEHTKRWDRNFTVLKRYVKRTGTADVPKRHVERGFKLGAWVFVQRRQYRQGNLSSDRVKRLEALPGWTWAAREGRWLANYEHLLQFVAREGHARVPVGHMEGSFSLGQWVHKQRRRKGRGALPRRRQAILNKLPGWCWSVRDETWERTYSSLQRFVERHGHCDVPLKYR
ncbi:helicase associated domain-containing protein, partial [Myxococcota bacterium]